jgi:hypothetical protein
MKTIFFLFLLSLNLIAQDKSMNLRGYEVELGMTMDQVWEKLKSGFNVIEDEEGRFFISDKYDAPIGIVFFENEIAVKIIKDWGTSNTSNVGQVFKVLWNVLKQYEKGLEAVKMLPLETFTPRGSKYALQIFLSDNRYIDITIQHSVTILEVLQEPVN